MGKKRRNGKASRRGNNSAAANSDGGGLQHTSTGIRYKGGIYEGELKGRKPHGKGRIKYDNGDVYDGEWKDGQKHGRGIGSYPHIGVYEGEWENNMQHGKGSIAFKDDGSVYVGGFAYGQMHGSGTRTWPTENVYEGQWANGTAHGEGAHTLSTGEIYQGVWVDGKLVEEDVMDRLSPREISPLNVDTRNDDIAPDANRELLSGRKLRSIRSQQRRLENAKKTCEICGVDDYRYKLRVCSGCKLALYCSAACQKAARGSHQRICDIVSMLPSRDSDQLTLEYDKDKLVDLDAGLRYGTKYMSNLKYLQINLLAMEGGDVTRLSPKHLSSLLRSKRGNLDSFVWGASAATDGFDVWKELNGLKQLRLYNMSFDDVQPLHDIIGQQKDSLKVLSLQFLDIDWSKAKTRRAVAEAVKSCKHLVKLNLQGGVLMDPDLKVMLQGLPNLRIFRLARDKESSHEFTDNTCCLIARKCPGLQELDLDFHNQLSVKGIRKIFEGCVHLRSFYTSTCKLSCDDVRSLLDIAPQLLALTLGSSKYHGSVRGMIDIIEATGGRTLVRFSSPSMMMCDPEALSAESREQYEQQRDLFERITSQREDPEVANEWASILEG